MTEQLGDVAYDDESALIFGAKGYTGEVPVPEVHLLQLPEADENGFVPDKSAYEAECAAEMILSLMRDNTCVTTPDGERKLQFGDIAVLLRNANSVGGVYTRIFSEKGIPVAGGQNGGLFETKEGSFVLSMLQIMDNPLNEVALLSVLSSPAVSFSGDELAAIRATDKDAGFYDALKVYSGENSKAGQFLAMLDAFRDAAPDLTAEKIIRMILYRTDILAVCSAMPSDHTGKQSFLRQNTARLCISSFSKQSRQSFREKVSGTPMTTAFKFLRGALYINMSRMSFLISQKKMSALFISSSGRKKMLSAPCWIQRESSEKLILFHSLLS